MTTTDLITQRVTLTVTGATGSEAVYTSRSVNDRRDFDGLAQTCVGRWFANEPRVWFRGELWRYSLNADICPYVLADFKMSGLGQSDDPCIWWDLHLFRDSDGTAMHRHTRKGFDLRLEARLT